MGCPSSVTILSTRTGRFVSSLKCHGFRGRCPMCNILQRFIVYNEIVCIKQLVLKLSFAVCWFCCLVLNKAAPSWSSQRCSKGGCLFARYKVLFSNGDTFSVCPVLVVASELTETGKVGFEQKPHPRIFTRCKKDCWFSERKIIDRVRPIKARSTGGQFIVGQAQ